MKRLIIKHTDADVADWCIIDYETGITIHSVVYANLKTSEIMYIVGKYQIKENGHLFYLSERDEKGDFVKKILRRRFIAVNTKTKQKLISKEIKTKKNNYMGVFL